MADLALIHEHMEIVGSDGQHVGAVLRVDGDSLTLASGDPRREAPRLPLDLVEEVEAVIRLNAPAVDVIKGWLWRHPGAIDSAPTTS